MPRWAIHQTWSPAQRPNCLAAASTDVTKAPLTSPLSLLATVISNGGQRLLLWWRRSMTRRAWELAEQASRSSSSWPSKPWTVTSITVTTMLAQKCKCAWWLIGNVQHLCVTTIKTYIYHLRDHHHHHLLLAPLRVRSATGRQQPPEWSVLGQVDCVGPWQPVGVEVVLHCLHLGHPSGLFQYTDDEEVKICLASILSSIWAVCPNRVRCHPWIISVSRGWLVRHWTSSLVMKWYHLMPRSIQRHHWWRALILRVSSQHSDTYRKIGNVQVL